MRSSFAVTKESTVGQTYNLGFGETTKIMDLAKMILKILNLLDKTEHYDYERFLARRHHHHLV